MSSNGIDNLIPTTTRSKEEARELGRLGGIASGKARREKKTIAQMLKTWCDKAASDEDKERLLAIGLTEDLTNRAILLAPLLEKAKDGDSKSIRLLYELMGEDQKREQEIKKLKAENELLKLEQQRYKAEISATTSETDALAKLCELITKGAQDGV